MQEESPSIYLAKVMCERKAKSEKTYLPPQYWNSPEWKILFKRQIIAANSLLKIYPLDVIKAAIFHKKNTWIWSLTSPALKQPLLEEMAKYEKRIIKDEHITLKLKKKEESIQIEQPPVILEDKVISMRNRLD
jgi:hypothetical protein